jgi:hypothetical protein
LSTSGNGHVLHVRVGGALSASQQHHAKISADVLAALSTKTPRHSGTVSEVLVHAFSAADSPFGEVPASEIDEERIREFVETHYGLITGSPLRIMGRPRTL